MKIDDRSFLAWEVGHHAAVDGEPEQWVSATVPGAVQLDWANAHGWPPFYVGDNWREYRWMEDVYWTYRATIDHSALAPNERLYFVCGGIDYAFDVRLDGKLLLTQEGMFTPVRLDLTERITEGPGLLTIRVHPAPKSVASPEDRVQANRSCKPAVSYGWDFHPRLIPLGIWQDAYAEVRPTVHLRDTETFYDLAPDLASVKLRTRIECNGPAPEGAILVWKLRDADGGTVCEQSVPAGGSDAVSIEDTLDRPILWWCHDQGRPYLYTVSVSLRARTAARSTRANIASGFAGSGS
jgi:beta-mannosidase